MDAHAYAGINIPLLNLAELSEDDVGQRCLPRVRRASSVCPRIYPERAERHALSSTAVMVRAREAGWWKRSETVRDGRIHVRTAANLRQSTLNRARRASLLPGADALETLRRRSHVVWTASDIPALSDRHTIVLLSRCDSRTTQALRPSRPSSARAPPGAAVSRRPSFRAGFRRLDVEIKEDASGHGLRVWLVIIQLEEERVPNGDR